MKKRTKSLPVLVLVAVMALVLGSFATATAAGVTTSQVKKIAKKQAKKVVKKMAPGLSVAHANTATTATNSTQLNGLPASAYLDNSTVYRVAVTTPATTHLVTIPLTPGNYNLAWSAWLVGGSGFSECFINQHPTAGSDFDTADETSSNASPAFSASGFVTVVTGDLVRLICTSGTNWTTASFEPIQIIVTPVDTVTNGTLTATRSSEGKTN
jgi:hypothetical protein